MRHEREREREGGREKARARERINVRADDRVLKGKSKEAEAKALKSLFIDFIKGVYFFVLYTRTWHLRYMLNTNKGMQCAHQQELTRQLHTGAVEVPQRCPADLKLERVVVSVLANFVTVYDAAFKIDSFLEDFFTGIEKVNGIKRTCGLHNSSHKLPC